MAVLLLAVYLPTVAVSSLHVHHDTVDEPDGCGRCAGHYDAPHRHQHDCQYCHFLSQYYVGRLCEMAVPARVADDCRHAVVEMSYCAPQRDERRLRSPPEV